MNSVEQTARLLFKAVKRASVNHTTICKGDQIVVTGADNDVIGIVDSTDTVGDTTIVVLDTSLGRETLRVSCDNFIHIIQRADMLNMRDHNDYERDLVDTDTAMRAPSKKDQRPKYGPSEGKSDPSALPTSKISLQMKTRKGGK